MNQPSGKDLQNTAKGVVKVAAGKPPTIDEVKSTTKVVPFCCGYFVFFAAFIFFLSTCTFSDSCGSASALEPNQTASVVGDTEFWVTHYDPITGGTNGNNCGGAMIKVCLDKTSPTGYVGKYPGASGSVVSTGVIAVPQDGTYHRYGKVNISQIPVPLIHTNAVLTQAKIIIPGYNNSQATPVGDHFATTITKPNRLDLACNGKGCQDMWNYWKTNKLVLDSASGLNGGSKIMGKIEGTVIR